MDAGTRLPAVRSPAWDASLCSSCSLSEGSIGFVLRSLLHARFQPSPLASASGPRSGGFKGPSRRGIAFGGGSLRPQFAHFGTEAGGSSARVSMDESVGSWRESTAGQQRGTRRQKQGQEVTSKLLVVSRFLEHEHGSSRPDCSGFEGDASAVGSTLLVSSSRSSSASQDMELDRNVCKESKNSRESQAKGHEAEKGSSENVSFDCVDGGEAGKGDLCMPEAQLSFESLNSDGILPVSDAGYSSRAKGGWVDNRSRSRFRSGSTTRIAKESAVSTLRVSRRGTAPLAPEAARWPRQSSNEVLSASRSLGHGTEGFSDLRAKHDEGQEQLQDASERSEAAGRDRRTAAAKASVELAASSAFGAANSNSTWQQDSSRGGGGKLRGKGLGFVEEGGMAGRGELKGVEGRVKRWHGMRVARVESLERDVTAASNAAASSHAAAAATVACHADDNLLKVSHIVDNANGVRSENEGTSSRISDRSKHDDSAARSGHMRALKLVRRGAVDAARIAFEALLKKFPGNVHIATSAGVFEAKQGNRWRAREIFRRGAETNPHNAAIRQAWALMEASRGHRGAATAASLFRASTEADPGHGPAWQAWAAFEARRGNEQRARQLARDGVAACGEYSPLLQFWAILEASLGNELAAQGLFLRAAAADQWHAHTWLAWARFELETSGTAAARRIFRRWLTTLVSRGRSRGQVVAGVEAALWAEEIEATATGVAATGAAAAAKAPGEAGTPIGPEQEAEDAAEAEAAAAASAEGGEGTVAEAAAEAGATGAVEGGRDRLVDGGVGFDGEKRGGGMVAGDAAVAESRGSSGGRRKRRVQVAGVMELGGAMRKELQWCSEEARDLELALRKMETIPGVRNGDSAFEHSRHVHSQGSSGSNGGSTSSGGSSSSGSLHRRNCSSDEELVKQARASAVCGGLEGAEGMAEGGKEGWGTEHEGHEQRIGDRSEFEKFWQEESEQQVVQQQQVERQLQMLLEGIGEPVEASKPSAWQDRGVHPELKSHGPILQDWARMEARCGHVSLARLLFRVASYCSPSHPQTWLQWGRFELSQGRTSVARQLFQTGIRADPKNRHLLHALAFLEKNDGNSPGALLLLATASKQKGFRFDARLESLRQELQDQVQRTPSHSGRFQHHPLATSTSSSSPRNSTGLRPPTAASHAANSEFRTAAQEGTPSDFGLLPRPSWQLRKAKPQFKRLEKGRRRKGQEAEFEGLEKGRRRQRGDDEEPGAMSKQELETSRKLRLRPETTHEDVASRFLSLAFDAKNEGDAKEASEFFRQSAKANSFSSRTWLLWGLWEISLGQIGQARAVFDRGLCFCPDCPYLYLAWGRLEIRLRNWETAQSVLRAGCCACPQYGPLWVELANCVLKRRKAPETGSCVQIVGDQGKHADDSHQDQSFEVGGDLEEASISLGNLPPARQKTNQIQDTDAVEVYKVGAKHSAPYPRLYKKWASLEFSLGNKMRGMQLMRKSRLVNEDPINRIPMMLSKIIKGKIKKRDKL